MKAALLPALLLLLALPAPARSEGISRRAFVELLLERHPLVKKERLSPDIEEAARRSTLGAADWQLTSTIEYAKEEPAFSLFSPEETRSLDYATSLGRTIWESGGSVSLGFRGLRSRYRLEPGSLFSYPEKQYEHALELRLSQPLLRDRGGRLTRLQHDLKRVDVAIAEARSNEAIEGFLQGGLETYLDWVFLEEQRAIVAHRLALSQEEYDRVEAKFEAFLVDKADLIRAQAAVDAWRQNLALVESALGATRAELAEMVGEPSLLQQRPEFRLYDVVELPPLAEAEARLEERSRQLETAELAQRRNRIDEAASRERTLPALSLVAAAGYADAADSFNDAFSLARSRTAIGLQLELPIQNRQARSSLDRARLQGSRLAWERQELLTSLRSSLAALSTRLDGLREVLGLNRRQIETARRRTAEEVRLYEQGRGELTFVIASRDALEAARLSYAENALAYQKALLAYRALQDELYLGEEAP